MANFPRPEADIKVLVITGLTGNADFLNLPIKPKDMPTQAAVL